MIHESASFCCALWLVSCSPLELWGFSAHERPRPEWTTTKKSVAPNINRILVICYIYFCRHWLVYSDRSIPTNYMLQNWMPVSSYQFHCGDENLPEQAQRSRFLEDHLLPAIALQGLAFPKTRQAITQADECRSVGRPAPLICLRLFITRLGLFWFSI